MAGIDNNKDIACKNVGIYGYCRYADKGCLFKHEVVKVTPPRAERYAIAIGTGEEPKSMLIDLFSSKLGLNVDSPSFTPSSLVVNGNHPPAKSSRLSPKAVNAAPFKPKGSTPGIFCCM